MPSLSNISSYGCGNCCDDNTTLYTRYIDPFPAFGTVTIDSINKGIVVDQTTKNVNMYQGVLFVDDVTNRVGINTTTPSTDFHVVGSGLITGNFTVDTSTLVVDSTNNRVGILTASPTETLHVIGNGIITGTLAVDTNTLYVDATNNKVGINTAAPSEALHVIGNGIVSGNFTVDTSTLHVDSTNNAIGIKTTSPLATLDVRGDVWVGDSISSVLYVDKTNSFVEVSGPGSPNYALKVMGGTAYVQYNLDVSGWVYANSITQRLGVGTNSPSTTFHVVGSSTLNGDVNIDSNTLKVDSTNNRVGIVTASPTEALEVTGNIKSSGTLTCSAVNQVTPVFAYYSLSTQNITTATETTIKFASAAVYSQGTLNFSYSVSTGNFTLVGTESKCFRVSWSLVWNGSSGGRRQGHIRTSNTAGNYPQGSTTGQDSAQNVGVQYQVATDATDIKMSGSCDVILASGGSFAIYGYQTLGTTLAVSGSVIITRL